MKKIIGLLLVYIFIVSNVMARDLRFVQVTDVRYTKSDENQSLSRTVKDINRQKGVDFVVFTGNMLQRPNVDDLKSFLGEAKKLKRPFYLVIGDKDVNKHKDLSKKQFAKIAKRNLAITKKGNINYTFEKNGVFFIVADGAKDVIPSSNGYYKDDTVEWVESKLDTHKNENVIILQHFPLIPPNDNENYMTYKPEKYLEVLNSHKNVKAVISGHFGVNKETEVDGITHISTAPAPQYRIIDVIDCTSENPTFWAEIRRAE